MEPFHVGNFRPILQEYVDYVDRDDVLSQVVAGLRRHLTRTGRDWNDASRKKNEAEPLPADPLGSFALRYDLMRTAVKHDRFDLRNFVTSLYPGSHLNEKLMHWKRAIVHPFAADFRNLGVLLLERLPKDEWFELEGPIQQALDALAPVAFGPRAWTDADDEAASRAEETAKAQAKRSALGGKSESSPDGPAPATAAPETFASALEALGRAVESSSGLAPDDRHDLALEVKILALEVQRRAPGAGARLRSRLDAVASFPGLAETVARVRGRLPAES
jgi:hypothetical protein